MAYGIVREFENGYIIQEVFAVILENGERSYVYDFNTEAKEAHPGKEIVKGYAPVNYDSGLTPDGCARWNDTIEDAMGSLDDYLETLPVYDGEGDTED